MVREGEKLEDDLAAFLFPLTAFAEEMHPWPVSTMRLACYLTDDTPPFRYVVSARAVVTDGDKVLVVEDPIHKHIMPGGMLEPNETSEDALRREVLEETGWSLASFRPIGILHFHHTESVPEGWPYPHPDFLHIVYAATPGEYHPELREVDGYELGAEFVPVDETRRLPLNAGQHAFLDVALRASVPVVRKAVAYVTRGDYLLVFRHVHSDAGIQVPAGTLRPDESPDVGVLREAQEETGLDGLSIRRFLGTRDHDMSPYGKAELHRRYYYHLECTSDAPSIWRHLETGGGTAKGIEFELYWVKLPDQAPKLAAAQGDFLAELGASLRLG